MNSCTANHVKAKKKKKKKTRIRNGNIIITHCDDKTKVSYPMHYIPVVNYRRRKLNTVKPF